jgi:hypothetical protein
MAICPAAALAELSALGGHRFNVRIEAVIADRLLSIECQPQMAERFVVKRSAEQITIGGTARLFVIAQSEVERVRLAERVRPEAGPAVESGIPYQAGAHGVKLNVKLTEGQIGFSMDQRGFVAAVPEGAGTITGGVDLVHVVAKNRDQHLRHALGLFPREQLRDMAGHQHAGAQPAALAHWRLVQPAEGSTPVLGIEEVCRAAAAALRDVQQSAADRDPCAAVHEATAAEIEPLST